MRNGSVWTRNKLCQIVMLTLSEWRSKFRAHIRALCGFPAIEPLLWTLIQFLRFRACPEFIEGPSPPARLAATIAAQ